jgi:hypothetical protein
MTPNNIRVTCGEPACPELVEGVEPMEGTDMKYTQVKIK